MTFFCQHISSKFPYVSTVKKWRTCYFGEKFFNSINKFPVLFKTSEKEKKKRKKYTSRDTFKPCYELS